MSHDCKPFACDDCDQKFKKNNALIVHRRIHTGEKSFACPDCEKKFKQSCNLIVHRRIHTGENRLSVSTVRRNSHNVNI